MYTANNFISLDRGAADKSSPRQTAGYRGERKGRPPKGRLDSCPVAAWVVGEYPTDCRPKRAECCHDRRGQELRCLLHRFLMFFVLSHDGNHGLIFLLCAQSTGKEKHHAICRNLLGACPPHRRHYPGADHQGSVFLPLHRRCDRCAVCLQLLSHRNDRHDRQ